MGMTFDKGQWPTILCINEAKTPMGVDFNKLVGVMQKYIDKCLGVIWGVKATVKVATDARPGCWLMYFIDDADEANALGYHDITDANMPVGKVFVKTTIDAKELVSVTATHELAEMLIDPGINACIQSPDGRTFYSKEICDACEEETFEIDGIKVSDFVFPSYFEGFRQPLSTQFCWSKKITKPYQILPGGYMPIFKGGKWAQVFGSEAKRLRFMNEDRRGHRTEIRKARGLGVDQNVFDTLGEHVE